MNNPDICYYAYKMEIDDEEVTFVKGFPSNVSADKFFKEVSNKICFSDCEPVDIVEIMWHNTKIWYVGWQPGMLYQFGDMYRNLVWEGRFPEWDH